MSQAPTKTPAELRAERQTSLRTRWNRTSGGATLTTMQGTIERTGSNIEALSRQLQEFRRRGYRYNGGWEASVEALSAAWPDRQREARRLVREHSAALQALAREIDALADRPRLTDAELDQLDNRIGRFEARVRDAETAIRRVLSPLDNEHRGLKSDFDRVDFMFSSLDSASFPLLPEEQGVAACEAQWISDRDQPKGILFLTTHRVLFEQRERKATKKVLFVTTQSEMVQQLMWESPVGAVSRVEIEDQRSGVLGLGSKELITFTFEQRTRELPGPATLQISGTTNEEWQRLIQRVQDGSIEQDTVGRAAAAPAGGAEPAAEAAAAPSLRDVPTKCPSCGAQLPPVYRGMQSLQCEYCDATIRL